MNEKLLLKKLNTAIHSETAKLLRTIIPLHLFQYFRNKRILVFFLIFYSFFIATTSTAQFCQTWSLAASTAQTANSGASTMGNTEVIGIGMSAPAYGTYQSFPKPGGVNWPGTVNTANDIYLEFPITPAAGNNLVITSITFSAYQNNGSGTRLTANVYNGTTAAGATADITSTTAGTPTNVSMTGLSIPVANGTTAPIRLYITGNNSRTLNIQNVVICGTSTAAYCADATLGPVATVAAGNVGNGTSNNVLTNFSIGASTNLTLTNFSFPFTNTSLVAGDLVNYRFWYSATNSFTSATVLSTVTTGLAASPINFGGFSQAILSNTAGYFWVTANIAAGATTGHSITASALTPANLTFSGTPTTCGSAPAQGTKTIAVLTTPIVTTAPVTSITSTTATAGGNITSDGGSTITQSGVVYSISPVTDTNNTVGGAVMYNAVNGTGAFTTSLTGLQPGTTYYITTFAVNAAGISYGVTQTFTTPPTPPRNCNGTGPFDGSAAKEGTFYLYGYVKAGERIDWNVIRTDDGGASNWTISVYTPTGLYSTCTIGTTIGNQCATAQITVTAATEGIWTLVATPLGNDGNDVVCPALNVYTAGGTNLPGRVWTESLHGHDESTGVEPDFTLYFLTPSGYEYSATYSGMNGLNYTIVSDTLGVRTAAGSCVSAYQSVSYSGPNPLLGPDNANCGKKNKIFFAPFDSGLPASAVRFNVAAGSGQVTEQLINEPVVPSISNVTFIRPTSCSSVSNITFTVTNFSEEGIIYIDVNNNGIYTDPVDVIDTVVFVNGVNSVPFNGLDGLGNPMPRWQPLTVKVAIEKIGETHFVQSDIEIFGGLTVTRLNGPGAPDNTLYWNDSNLPVGDNCAVTPLLDATAGVNSSGGGVHNWDQCGTCSPPRATCGSTNNSTLNNGSWGNQRLIDNWTYITDSTLNRTLFISSFVDTTFADVCPSQLPYSWHGRLYNATGTYYDTLTSTIGCDSLVTLILTVNNCSFGDFATAPYIGTCNNNSVSSGFYNTTGTGVDLIGTNTFTGTNLGSYIQNSNYLILNGGEVKTFKNALANVCGSTMYYVVYPQGSRPANPVFTVVPLPFFDICSGSNFPSGGPCSPNDQKWQRNNLNVNLTTRVPGNYTIEVYYQVVGDDNSTSTCNDTLYVNNSGNNFTAGFSIVAPPTISYTPSTFCTTVNAPQPVNLTAFPGGTFSASPSGLNINSTTGSVTPSLSSPGTYNVKYVFDLGQNCPDSVITAVTITPPPVIFAHGTNPTCFGICDGTATVDVVGGTSPYSYSWDNGGLTKTISNLCEGIYVVTVTDASNCAVSNSPIVQPGCFQVKSILVDACSPNEYDQEMVFFQVGQSPLNYTSLNVTWPTFTASGGVNDPWQGLCTNATFISNVNATITGGGILLPAPVSGILPAGANVVLITSNALNTSFNSFANLTDTVYVLFQCSSPANNVGHFANNGPLATRTLIMNFGVGCRDTVSYDTSQLTNINGGLGGSAAINNGAYVNYTSNGVPGYFNYGCIIPYQTLTAEVTLVAPPKTEPTFASVVPVCQNAAAPVLPTSSTNTIPVTGTWSPAVSTTTAGTTVYTFTPTAGQCADTASIIITVKPVSTSTKDTAVCQNNLPYVWLGNNYNTAGTYNDTLVNATGCDSILTLNLTIKSQTTSTTNVSVCAATLPYNWNGTPYNAGGTYVFNTTNAAGCDSVATLNLTILNETTSTANVSVCAATLPYNWNGTLYNTGGSYVFKTTNAAGCDSVATLTLAVLTETSSTTNISVCTALLPYTWNGTPYNAGGSYVFNTTNAAGCDSVATLNLAILNETTSTTNVSVCAANLPYNWNGTPYNAAGAYVFNTTNAAGCDSVATLNLTILNESTSTTNISVCSAALPYTWNGTPYNAGGSYVYHTTNAAGCDSAATLNLTISNETTSTTNVSVCAANLPYNWNGTPYNSGGAYVFNTTNAAGCDSTATLNLTILIETTSTTNVSVCAATLPYNWNGTPYNADGSYVFNITNAAGCDSAAILNLTILSETTSTTNVSVCAPTLPYNWNGTPYNAGGSYVFNTTNAAGCDSTATLNLAILNETTSTTSISVCAAALPYNWNGTPYNAGGTYVFNTMNAAGCDSTATLNLTILNETTSTTNVSICAANLPYIWNGTPYNSGGSYVFNTTNAVGCDSTATLNLTILNETTSTTNISVCAVALPYNWNGTPYNAGGAYVFNTTNAAGCDSTATLNLTILSETTSTTNVSVCAATLPYNWNGTPYNTGGAYVFNTTNAAGCDSTATLNLTILNETTSTTNVSVCAATLPYIWNGTPYNAAGTYVFNTTNAAGCDSTATLNLTILNDRTSTTNVSVCAAALPYTWNGTPYNAVGSYVFNTTNAAGCDSTATLNLTILNETTSTTNVSVCAVTLPYNWNGTPYNAGGSYVFNTTNAAGCDSVATLSLTILNETTSTTNVSVCTAALPYTWNGTPYNASGSYVFNTMNVAGCDSTATLNLTILNETTSTTNVSVCSATLPYNWNGTPYNAGGAYVFHTTNAAGCDSTATLNLTILNETTSTTNVSVCAANLPYNWNGTPYNAGGSYVFITTNAAGCDSIATLNLTILNETTSTTNVSVCAATLPYVWNSNSYSTSGSYVYHTTNAAGCDSAATLNLTILNETTSTTNISVCATTLPYTWNGTPYNAGGSHVFNTINAAGCDSAATLNLTILNSSSSTTDIVVCAAQLPYTWNGNSYNAAGSYNVTLVNAAGCDSLAALNLSINPVVTSTTDITTCTTQLPYIWNSNSYSAAGSYSVTLTNVAGCDSVATLNLAVNPQLTSTTDIVICTAQLPYIWNGSNYNAAGSYNVTLVSVSGCDSIAILNLAVNQETTSITNISVCSATLPYVWNGNSYNAAGSYVFNTTNAAGCDSTATLNLILLNETTSTTNVTVCAPSLPYVWNGNSYSIAGPYIFHTTNAAGCDSAATLNLSVSNAVTSTTNIAICNAQLPYTWNGNTYNAAGSFNVTLVSASGCDSITTLNLTVNNAVTSTTDIAICNAQLPYAWNGNSYNAAGSYNVTLVSASGCDSIATLNLSVNSAVASTTDIAICNAQLPYTWNGNSYNSAGSYNVTLVSAGGCDSIATLNLAVNNAVTSTTDVAFCNAQLPYTWNGNNYNSAGSFNVTLVSASGCDSIATLNLSILNETVSTTSVSVCAATLPYVWNGNSYSAAGLYVFHTINAAGCDSAATLNLSVLGETISTTNVSVCAATLPYTWNGTLYNAAGSYVFHTTNAAGCDSAATLNLSINPSTTSTTAIAICPAQLPYSWNENNYNAAGSYNATLVNAAGCDSVAILNLSVNPAVTSTTDVAICNAQLPYSWNGNNYNAAGSFNVTLVNVAGCDSIATLNLSVNPAVTSTTDVTICNAQLPYSWNGNNYNAAGSYNVTLASASGCDSIATLNLAVNQETTSITSVSVCTATLPYVWNGNSYSAAGSYVFNTTNASGCDSTATLNLIVLNETTSIANVGVCAAALPYVWNGNSYSAAGSYVFHTTNAAGCDSAATLNLSIGTSVTSTTNIAVCPAQLPYSWNGNNYNTAASYSVTLVSVSGCDSIATLNLAVNAAVTSTTNVAICNAQLPYSWNGNNYNAAGSYNVTLVNGSGCDSIATLNLSVNPAVTSTTDIAICNAQLPYTWNGNNYNAAGSYNVTLVSASGCDSIATLNLIVNNVVTSTTDITICTAQLPYSWNGNNYNAAGSYNVTLTNVAGCDSIATLNLTVNNAVTSTTDATICSTQLPYLWNGNNYNAAGLYDVTLISSAGCDSIATLNLVVDNAVASTTDVTICNAQLPYSWNANNYSAAGSYNVTLVSANGCDSVATLNLLVNNAVTSSTSITICPVQLPYTWNGNIYNTAGSYNVTLVSANGCDSVATLNLLVNNAVTSSTNIAICPAQLPYTWNGNIYNAAGSYNVTLVSASGCDSIATLNLIVNAVVTSTADITICTAQLPYTWNGQTYNAAGSYNVALTNVAGCDSIATLNLIVNNAVASTTDVTICNNQLPYSWNGNNYSAAGSYNVTLVSASGCDSITTLNLTVNTAVTSTTDVTICNGQLPYSWNGNSYNTAGSYNVTLVSAAGCDSIATLNLTVNNDVTSITDITICNTQLPYSWNGNNYNAAGSFSVALVSASGCDSIATLNLAVNNGVTSVTDINICPVQLPYTWNGNAYNAAGSYNVTLVSASGCDSVTTLNLTVSTVVTSTTDVTICTAQLPYSWNGNTYNTAGTYSVTLVNIAGCDSIATLNLVVNNAVTSTTDIAICNSQLPYIWNGNSYSTAGSYNVTLVSSVGCDSIATLNLIVNNAVTSTTSITICNTQLPYSWNGHTYNIAGNYAVTLVASNGCDSVATLNLTVTNAVTSTTNVTICNGQLPYLWNGNNYNGAGSYSITLVSASGCDSVATLNLTVNVVVTSITDITICPPQLPYPWNGNSYNAAGSYTVTLVSASGCDSVATLNLVVNAVVTSATHIAICTAQLPYSWNGNSYNAAGSYSVTLINVAGCDSIATLNLTVNNTVTSITNIAICNTQLPYSWNGNNYNAGGLYNVTLVSAAGCDSIATLNLTVNNSVTSTTDITICNTQLPYSWNGNNYSAAGSYNVTLVSASGCDSVATLNLIVNNSVASNTDVTICNSQLPYSWNGNNYNAAGSYTVTLSSASGCDSIATLNLIVNNTVTSTTNINICPVQLPYSWNGNNYSAAGLYTVTLVSATGCDSIATLNLTVSTVVTSTTDITICPAQLPYSWSGNTYNAAGTYSVTLVNIAGCDSIATVNLTINNVVTSTTNVTICNTQLPYAWNGNNYSAAGSYNVNLVSAAGCDSIATLNLAVNNAVTSRTNLTICNTQLPYSWNGNSYSAAGSYNVTLVSASGCDSIVTLNLTVNNAVTSTTDVTICNSQLPYSWNGNNYNGAGSYNVTLVSASGCDSIATLNLVVNNAVTSTTNITICPAQLPYSWNGNAYNAAGAYNITLVSAAGCDSIATLNLTVNAVVTSTNNIGICNAQLPYLWNGNFYNAAGSYNVTLVNVAGCDSIVTLNLVVNNAVTSNTNIAICNALLPYSWNGNSYNSAGAYNITLISAAGCDSIATLNLAVNNLTSSITNISVCAAALPYIWNGNNYNNTGSYNATLVNAAGCDSITTLNLTVLNATSSVSNTSVCAAQLPYSWNGNTYSAAGLYVYHTTNAAGCDSAATLILTILNATSSATTSVSVCAGSLPYVWNGNSYNATGIYTYHTTNAAGCDSTATLNLTVNIVATSITDIKVCDAQLPYVWNDNTYNTTGEYTVMLTSASGCDSFATLKLTSVNPVIQNNNLTGCSSVTFNGTLYTSSNTVQQTIQSAGGCDSVYLVTNITITHETFDLSIAASPNPAMEGDVVQFITSASAAYNVTGWQPAELFTSQNDISQRIVADSNMQISVTAVSVSGCLATAYYSLKVNEPTDFWVPNAFTPNGDGDNDFFSAYGTTIKKGLLRVYNQWGQLIFETADIKKGWDGKFKGVPQPVGVYAYVVFAEMFNGSSVTDKGFLNLIR